MTRVDCYTKRKRWYDCGLQADANSYLSYLYIVK